MCKVQLIPSDVGMHLWNHSYHRDETVNRPTTSSFLLPTPVSTTPRQARILRGFSSHSLNLYINDWYLSLGIITLSIKHLPR